MQTSINEEVLKKETESLVNNLEKMEHYVYADASLFVLMDECDDKELSSKIKECSMITESRIDSIQSLIIDTIEKSNYKNELIEELQSFVKYSETYSFEDTCKEGKLGKYL